MKKEVVRQDEPDLKNLLNKGSMIEDVLCELKTMRGALMIISEANQLDPEDYQGLSGQIGAYACIAEQQLEVLDKVIKDLGKEVKA